MRIIPKTTAGNVLFATVAITGLISLYMGTYLSLVGTESRTTRRSQAWNMAIPIAEAGLEEALTQIQATLPNLKAVGAWTFKNGGACLTKTNYLSTNEYYIVGIFPAGTTNGVSTPVVVSEGFVRLPQTTNFISRTIRVDTKLDGYTMPGMVVVTSASMNGNKLEIDSFNSTNNAYSTAGKYDVAKRRDKAYLGTLSKKTNSIDLGNADVWGKVASAPTGSKPAMGASSIVGSAAWHASGKKGLDPTAYTDDVNLVSELPVAPFTSAIAPVPILGVTTLLTGDYAVDNLTGTVLVKGNARLLVTKTFNVTSLVVSNLTGTATLDLYVAAANVNISGGLLNVQGRASNFKYYGLGADSTLGWAGNQTITAGGNGQLNAMIYAPGAALSLAGGGSAAQDFSGACLVKSVSMAGHYSFHFDESCPLDMVKGFVAVSWNEINTHWSTILANNYTVKNL